jgi:hypothetical protein
MSEIYPSKSHAVLNVQFSNEDNVHSNWTEIWCWASLLYLQHETYLICVTLIRVYFSNSLLQTLCPGSQKSRYSMTAVVLCENPFSRKCFIVRKPFQSLVARYLTLMHVVSYVTIVIHWVRFLCLFWTYSNCSPTDGLRSWKHTSA